jgi:hypothetical protein
VEEGEDVLQVVCDAGHEQELPVDEYTYYDIDFEQVIRDVAGHLDLEVADFDDSSLPRFVSVGSEDGISIYLIGSPSAYEKTVYEICMETIQDDTPALLITPEGRVDELLDIQSVFAGGNLIYSIPFTMLTEADEIEGSLETIQGIQDLEQRIVREELDDAHDVIVQANSNPRYILTELNHMRLLRLAGEIEQHSGTRLEKVGESAFSHLFATYPESGGEDDRGSNLPDSVFYISDQGLPEEYDSILGIVDTKSGADADFRSESVEGKHDEYLRRGRRESVAAENVAHIFVILDFDGQQELDFFDEMAEHYRDGEYMVIFTAEALSMVMAAYLAHTLSNELSLVTGNFRTAIYPFFDPASFRDAGLGEITREVGQNQDSYDQAYLQREDLLIVTEEVVRQRLEDCMDSPADIETIFSDFYRPLPTV